MTAAIPYWFRFDPALSPVPKARRARDPAGPALERRLYCRGCHQLITHLDERIAMNGANEHTFRNPYGFAFHIGCFKRADGCTPRGPATQAHTWFPGYAWRLDLCARCGLHLGWAYTAVSDEFHGLILDRLTSAGAGARA